MVNALNHIVQGAIDQRLVRVENKQLWVFEVIPSVLLVFFVLSPDAFGFFLPELFQYTSPREFPRDVEASLLRYPMEGIRNTTCSPVVLCIPVVLHACHWLVTCGILTGHMRIRSDLTESFSYVHL